MTQTVDIFERGVIIEDVRHKNPLQTPIRGDIGLLPTGKLVARWPFVRRDGTAVWATSAWAEHRDTAQPLDRPRDWFGQFESIREKRPGEWHVLDVTLEQPRLFDTGRTWYPKRNIPAFNAIHPPADVYIDWLMFLDRHAVKGDWGENGRYRADELDAVTLWTLHDQPVETLNRAAIAACAGTVRSRYKLDEETAKRIADPTRDLWPSAEILTIVSRAGNRTICYLDR